MRTFLLRQFKRFILLCLLFTAPILFAQKTITTGKVEFEFISKGVDGKISGFESSSSIDFENISNSKFKGSVAVKTIKTGIFLRDWSLKGRKYFDEDTHPYIEFESNSISEQGNEILVNGNLTIKGITKAVTINFKAFRRRTIRYYHPLLFGFWH